MSEKPTRRLTLRDVRAAMAFSCVAAAALSYVMAEDKLAVHGLLIVFYASLLAASILAAIGPFASVIGAGFSCGLGLRG